MERGERGRRRRFSEIRRETDTEREDRVSLEMKKILENLDTEESLQPERTQSETMQPVDLEFQKRKNELIDGVRERKKEKDLEWKKEMQELIEDVTSKYEKTDGRGEHREITMPHPEIRGEKIDSFEDLRIKVEKEFPGLKENPKYDEWMKDAEDYMKVHSERVNNPDISPEELRQKSRDMGIDRQKAEGWIHQEKEPRLLKYTREALTVREGTERVREIRESLNGVESIDGMEKRLDNFYLKPELENLPGNQMHREYAKSYYKYLNTLESGGLHTDIARQSGMSQKGGDKWAKGELPRLVRIASEVPMSEPQEGHKWLPLRVEGKNFKDFIEVPEMIRSYEDVKKVLDQLKTLESKDMENWRKRFGDLSKEDAFMYNLGAACSDGMFYRGSMTERFGMELGKKYDWSEQFGEATCYYWGKIGVRAGRIADRSSPYEWDGETRYSERMGWISEMTPVMNWVKRSGLGFNTEHSKSRIDASWIQDAPHSWKTAFIQGVADGDGWVASMNIGISTNSESKFYSEVLNSLGVESKASKERVAINRSNAIQDAAELPFFRHATGRQEKLDTLSEMFKASPHAGYMNKEEKRMVRDLSERGLSDREIRVQIWEDLGISRSQVAIWKHIKKLENRRT